MGKIGFFGIVEVGMEAGFQHLCPGSTLLWNMVRRSSLKQKSKGRSLSLEMEAEFLSGRQLYVLPTPSHFLWSSCHGRCGSPAFLWPDCTRTLESPRRKGGFPTGAFPGEIPCTGPKATPGEVKGLCHKDNDDTFTCPLHRLLGRVRVLQPL